MKNSLLTLALSFTAIIATAQVPALETTDSSFSNSNLSISANSSESSHPFEKKIRVKAGDVITFSAQVRVVRVERSNIRRKAVTAVVAGASLPLSLLHTESIVNRRLPIGLSLLITPSLFKRNSKNSSNFYLQLTAYDSSARLLIGRLRQAIKVGGSKPRQVKAIYQVLQDGVVEVSIQGGGRTYIEVDNHKSTITRKLSVPKSALLKTINKSTIIKQSSSSQPHQESDSPVGGSNCIDWYIVTRDSETGFIVDEEYVGTTCTNSNTDYGGGGDTTPPAPDQDPCTIFGINTGVNVNDCECEYIRAHPLNAYKAHNNKADIENHFLRPDIIRYFRDTQGHAPVADDDGMNAFKHALWQVMNTCAIGADHTRTIAGNHEICNGQIWGARPDAYGMDTHNNNIGIALATRNDGTCNSFNSMWQAVQAAYENHHLKKLHGCSNGSSPCSTP